MQHAPGFLALVEAARQDVEEIAASALPDRLAAQPDARLVDVREDHEWQLGHIRGAIHLGKGIIERDIERHVPDKDVPLYLYCGGGYRSVLAARALGRMGYRQVCSVDGGWRELQELMPVERD